MDSAKGRGSVRTGIAAIAGLVREHAAVRSGGNPVGLGGTRMYICGSSFYALDETPGDSMNTRLFCRHGLVLLLAFLAAPSLWAANVQDPASPTILLTGSNRGVGLALAQEYAARGWNVIATCRTPSKAKELQTLAAANPKVLVEKLDVTDLRQISKLAEKYRGVPVDVLFNNAAWLGEPISKQQFGNLDQDMFVEVMKTNVYGPLKLSEAFVDNIAASQQKKIIGMTSGLGSLTLMGRMSRFYYYQMSKAAMNMGMRALRNDLQGARHHRCLAGPRHGRYRSAGRLRLQG
jgi:short-subunit dehydrogenase involved in D-alanine esterification of teichoic acids